MDHDQGILIEEIRFNQVDTASYVAEICKELERLAVDADLRALAYFLGMARLEAEDCLDPRREATGS